ncbi:MAG: CoA transferase subunit A [Candidatus Thorarchaeota archaeon]|nr:CoA transferase subunit A [Candidatus Thorarchaeota archaeon]
MPSTSKLTSLQDAVTRFVHTGDCISLGGFTINRNPMALTHEIIRQDIGHLHVLMHSGSQAMDLLIGAKMVDTLEVAYGANGRLASTCVRFRKAVENGSVEIEDYSNYHMTLRFMAGAMGLPFLPTYSGLSTDIVKKWGIDGDKRHKSPQLPKQKCVSTTNPFSDEKEGILLIPAANPDVSLLHVHSASEDGTARIDGLSFADIEQARAAKRVIVSCEELVPSEVLRNEPCRNFIPHILIDAVVLQPFGAYPSACFRKYDYDMDYLEKYAETARDDKKFEEYLSSSIHSVDDFDEYLKQIEKKKLELLRADSKIGYPPRRRE